MAEQREVRELPPCKPHVSVIRDVGRWQPIIVRRRRLVVVQPGHGIDLITLIAHHSEDRRALEFLRDERAHPLLISIHRPGQHRRDADRKSTRLNSSHSQISYAVFCLKKKKITNTMRAGHILHAPTLPRYPTV